MRSLRRSKLVSAICLKKFLLSTFVDSEMLSNLSTAWVDTGWLRISAAGSVFIRQNVVAHIQIWAYNSTFDYLYVLKRQIQFLSVDDQYSLDNPLWSHVDLKPWAIKWVCLLYRRIMGRAMSLFWSAKSLKFAVNKSPKAITIRYWVNSYCGAFSECSFCCLNEL